MKHLGDITKINGFEAPIVHIITGGSPCQDLSVAGKRAGLDGERSGLFMEQIRIVKEMREHDRANGNANKYIRPRYMVWENVPGAFSSNKGEDFRCVLEEVCRIADKTANVPMPEKGKWSPSGCIMGDGWSVAWRVHDAQFWGVPQRRKRIALVADFGGASAPEILFERKSVSGDIEQSEQKGEEVAGAVGESIDTASAYTLKIRGGADTYIKSNGSIGTAGKGPLVQTELSATLGVSQDQTLIAIEGNGSRDSHKGDGYKEADVMYTLNTVEQHAVCYSQDAYDKFAENDNSASLKACGGSYGGGVREPCDTVGALCAVDYKGAGNQYVNDGKLVIQRIE